MSRKRVRQWWFKAWPQLILASLLLVATACGGGGGGGGGGAPGNVNVAPGGGGGGAVPLVVTWTAPATLGSDGNPLVIAAFNVYRGTAANNLAQIGSVTVNNNPPIAAETTFTDTTVVSGTTYFYAVTAVDTLGTESPRSAVVSATAP